MRHPVYTSHIEDIRNVLRCVTRLHIRQSLLPPEKQRPEKQFISQLFDTLVRIYQLFTSAESDVIYVNDKDFDIIRKAVSFADRFPECGRRAC